MWVLFTVGGGDVATPRPTDNNRGYRVAHPDTDDVRAYHLPWRNLLANTLKNKSKEKYFFSVSISSLKVIVKFIIIFKNSI